MQNEKLGYHINVNHSLLPLLSLPSRLSLRLEIKLPLQPHEILVESNSRRESAGNVDFDPGRQNFRFEWMAAIVRVVFVVGM